MKTFLCGFFVLITWMPARAQVGIGTSNPAPSAVLDVTGIKGFLPPRLTLEQIKQIASPAAGLMVYNLSSNRPVYFNGTNWINFSDTFAVFPQLGQYYPPAGGVVIHLDVNGIHGIVADTTDVSISTHFGCFNTSITGAQATGIGTGNSNTTAIVAMCTTAGIAAKLCYDLVRNGFSDWYLPSRDELGLIYTHRPSVRNIANGYYISSSEQSASNAWMIDMTVGSQLSISKTSLRYARAVRNF